MKTYTKILIIAPLIALSTASSAMLYRAGLPDPVISGSMVAPAEEKTLTAAETEQLCGLDSVTGQACDKFEKQETKKLVHGTITTYQAVPEQTDSTPCEGAMANIDFCNPPFPIVANDQLPLGAKVEIQGTVYTVADRFGADKPLEYFDILTDGENYTLTNEPIIIR